MLEQNNEDEFIGFDEFFINISPFQVLRKRIYVSEVHLIGSRANILQKGDQFNFSDLLERISDSTALSLDTLEYEDVDDSSFLDEYTVTVKNFTVENADLEYKDLEFNEGIGFQNINFILPEFTLGDSSSSAQLELDFDNGGSLQTSIFLDMEADVFQIDIDIDSMSVEPANLYILRNDYYNIQDISGRYTQHIHIEGDPNHPLSATHSGDIEIENFAIIDERGNEFFALKELDFHFDSLNWANKVLLIDYLILEEPKIEIEVLEESNTFAMLVDLPDSLESEVPDDEAEEDKNEELAIQKMSEDAQQVSDYTAALLHLDEYTYRVDSIVIREGTYTVIDRSLSKGFRFDLDHFNLKTEGFGSGNFQMQFEGIINRKGRMNMQISKIPEEKQAFDVIYTLSNLDLDDFTPYSVHFTGSPIEDGKMDLYSVSAIRGNSIASENAIDFLDLDFGKKQQKGVYNLPVKFAVSLLKNPKGEIDLDIPIEGSLDDPNFRLGKEIMQAILNISFNVVASPGKFIASLFKKDEKELTELDYQYLRPELVEKEMKTLEDLKQILGAKTGVNISVVQCGDYNLAKGKYALTRAKSDYYRAFKDIEIDSALTADDSVYIAKIEDDDSLFLAYIAEKVPNRELDLEEKSVELFGEEKIKMEFDSLLEMRNEFIRSYFRKESELTPDRIKVLNSNFDTLSTENKRPYYMVNFVPPDE
jgi:hypothetical protein